MIPTSKSTFIAYCLRMLGGPVIEINVAAEQTDDRVDEALQLYQLFHMDAVDRMLLTHEITQEDLDNQYLTIIEPVMTVTRVFFNSPNITTGDFASDLWQSQSKMFGSLGFKSCSSTGLSDYAISMQHLSDMNYMLGNFPTVQYSSHSNRLYIDDDWSKFTLGQSIAYEAYVKLDPNTHNDVWNDVWLKEYSTALIGRQWGENLSKFQQVELPGGITLNGDAIYDRYDTRVKELKEELELNYSFPADFSVG